MSVVEGRLIVEGDELGNQIAITAGPEPGSYAVHGLDGTNVILQPPPVDPAGGEPMSTVVVHGVRRGCGSAWATATIAWFSARRIFVATSEFVWERATTR